jgi:pyruvate dehydrogenase E2 component (dihydrolipoamide acetyltransferase)
VSTDKVDTEIPSPVSGVLRGITVSEDETVAVGAELAVIDEDGAAGQQAAAEAPAPPPAAAAAPAPAVTEPAPAAYAPAPAAAVPEPEPAAAAAPVAAPAADYQQPAPYAEPRYAEPAYAQPADTEQAYAEAPVEQAYAEPAAEQAYAEPPAEQAYAEAAAEQGYAEPAEPAPAAQAGFDPGNGASGQFADGTDGPYVTPLVRKLAAEHGIDLAAVNGTGVGGRIRKQDVLDAARSARGPDVQQPAAPQAHVATAPVPAAAAPAPALAPAIAVSAFPAPAAAPAQSQGPRSSQIVPSSLRGTSERMSRARQVIARRMVESLQTSAQLTTVVEADVTAIARLRNRAKAAFEAREGVKLSFLPFFALAAVEALKVHPKLNAVIDTASSQVTYHDAEHLGIAVDTERGLMVPVIRNAGDLNIGGLARKIADLAERTRAGQVSPDDLAGGTFTLTNTGSRGALFDTPIINQPQVGILGTGTVVKRAVVVEDPTLGEVITVRSMVYLALTYDHRLVDGADAVRFLTTMKARLEEGAFETELGL